jgi:hypothetical protein
MFYPPRHRLLRFLIPNSVQIVVEKVTSSSMLRKALPETALRRATRIEAFPLRFIAFVSTFYLGMYLDRLIVVFVVFTVLMIAWLLVLI